MPIYPKLFNTEKRILIALSILLWGRDQDSNPITQPEIAKEALVAHRTVQYNLPRLVHVGLITVNGSQGIPARYGITPAGEKYLEAYR